MCKIMSLCSPISWKIHQVPLVVDEEVINKLCFTYTNQEVILLLHALHTLFQYNNRVFKQFSSFPHTYLVDGATKFLAMFITWHYKNSPSQNWVPEPSRQALDLCYSLTSNPSTSQRTNYFDQLGSLSLFEKHKKMRGLSGLLSLDITTSKGNL